MKKLTRYVSDIVDLVIYAPPHTEKSMTFDTINGVYDTHYTSKWYNSISDGKVIVTNDITMCKLAIHSIAIVPSLTSFEQRCKLRGLQVKPTWYPDILDAIPNVECVVFTDEYMSKQLLQRVSKKLSKEVQSIVNTLFTGDVML